MGNLDAAAALGAGSRFETMVEESFVVLLPNRDDFDRARDWLSRFETGLRAVDALHLAIAWNRGADAIHRPGQVDDRSGKEAGLARKRKGSSFPGHVV